LRSKQAVCEAQETLERFTRQIPFWSAEVGLEFNGKDTSGTCWQTLHDLGKAEGEVIIG
jgi:hypothetical protein